MMQVLVKLSKMYSLNDVLIIEIIVKGGIILLLIDNKHIFELNGKDL